MLKGRVSQELLNFGLIDEFIGVTPKAIGRLF